MEAQEHVRCRGHPRVLGTHPTTFEVTREVRLTENGNCIIGIAADRGCAGLSGGFKRALARDDALLSTWLECGGVAVEVTSRGSARMTLDHPTDMVWRRSAFVCGRTIGILSNAVAATLPEDLIRNLTAGKEMLVTLTVTCPG